MITNVIHVPNISANLLSVPRMTEKGCVVVFDNEQCRIFDRDEIKIVGEPDAVGRKVDGLYKIQSSASMSKNPQVNLGSVGNKSKPL